MGVVIRQSIKATLVSYVGAGIGALLVIYIYPKCLTPEQIGLTRVLLEAALIFSSFAQIGMSSIAIKFYPYFKDPKKNDNGFTFLVFVVPIAGFMIFSVLFFAFQSTIVSLFSQKSALFTTYLYFVLPLTLFSMYTVISETYASLLQRIVVPKIVKEILIRILTIIIVVIFFLKVVTLDQFVALFTLIYGVATILDVGYVHKIKKLHFRPDFTLFRTPLKKDILQFTAYMIVVSVGAMVAGRIDVFMVSSKVSLSGTGIFTIAFFIASFIEMPSRAMFQMITPFTSEALKNNDLPQIDSLYKRTSINQLVVASLLFMLLWVNADNIFTIMPHGEIFAAGKYVILFIGLAKVFDAVTGINGYILGNSKYYYYTLYFIFFLAILTVAMNLYFIPLWGIVGSAVATCTSIIVYNLVLVFFVQWKLGVQPFTRKTVVAVLILVIAYGCSLVIPHASNPFLDAAVRSIIVGTCFVWITYWLKVSDDINNVIMVGFQRVRGFIAK